jgi:hypothetical protein
MLRRVTPGTKGAFRLVKPEICLAASFVRPVASEAAVAEDRAYIAVVLESGISAQTASLENESDADKDELQPSSDHD